MNAEEPLHGRMVHVTLGDFDTDDAMSTMRQMLRTDLGILSTDAYDNRLSQYLRAAASAVRAEGATPDYSDIGDQALIVMYAAYLWRRRDSMEAMPRMLRYSLNRRVLAEKARGPQNNKE